MRAGTSTPEFTAVGKHLLDRDPKLLKRQASSRPSGWFTEHGRTQGSDHSAYGPRRGLQENRLFLELTAASRGPEQDADEEALGDAMTRNG